MPNAFDSLDYSVENYLNWVNTVGRKKQQRRHQRPRKRRHYRWGCAIPSSVISSVLLAALILVVQ